MEGIQFAQTLTTAIRQKSPNEQIINILKDIPNPLLMEASGDIEPRFNPLQIDVFVQTLLHFGAKSFTHSFVAINRYYEVLKVRKYLVCLFNPNSSGIFMNSVPHHLCLIFRILSFLKLFVVAG